MSSYNTPAEEMELIRLILTVSAKGHDSETIANALELSTEYVETILELADEAVERSPEAVYSLLCEN